MRQRSTTFDRFEIVVVPFPFVDVPKTKPRPALIISVRRFSRQNGHTRLAMITTAQHMRWPSDYTIRELQPTGLRVACVVRWKLFTPTTELLGGASVIWAGGTGTAAGPRSRASSMAPGPTERSGADADAHGPTAVMIRPA